MLKRKKEDALEKWFSIIHNDLYHIEQYVSKPSKGDNYNTYEQLKGLRNSILLDACSGIAYLCNGKIYSTLTEIAEDLGDKEEYDIIRIMNVDYLLQFIDQILE